MHTLGLQYDEALFVNGAIDPDTTQFVTVRWGGVPIMLMDYIGALKAWLYAAVFAAFGVSVETIRIPMVLLFAASVVLAARFVGRRTTPWAGALAALRLVTGPAFTVMSRNDWGPVMIPGFLRVALLVVLVAIVTTRRWLLALAVIVALGTFNKLDFAISAAALVAASILAFLPEWRSLVRSRPVPVAVTAAVLALTAAVVFVTLYLPARSRLPRVESGILERVPDRLALVGATFDADYLAAYMLRGDLAVSSLAIPLALAVIGVAGIVAALRRGPAPSGDRRPSGGIGPGRLTIFLVLAGLFTLVGLIAIDQVAGHHHAASLWPYPWLAVATSLAFLVGVVRERRVARPLGIGALALAGALTLGLLGSQIGASASFDRLLADTSARPPIWTFDTEPAAASIDELAGNGGPVVVADWGIGNQLIAFDDRSPEDEFVELWPEFRVSPAGEVFEESGISGPFLLVYHDDDSQVFAGTTDAARAVVAACVGRVGASDVRYRGDDVIVREVTCPVP